MFGAYDVGGMLIGGLTFPSPAEGGAIDAGYMGGYVPCIGIGMDIMGPECIGPVVPG